MSISNNGSSSISPAFQVSPSISFKAESNGKSIPPGSSMGYSLLFNTSRIIRDGIYDFNLSASSGTYKQTVPIKILMVNISQLITGMIL